MYRDYNLDADAENIKESAFKVELCIDTDSWYIIVEWCQAKAFASSKTFAKQYSKCLEPYE